MLAGIRRQTRRRTSCTNVGMVSKKCEHGRRRTRCKECGGGSFCEHGRRRSYCKECGGSGICEHGRVRSVCKECGPGGSHLIILEATEVELGSVDGEEEPDGLTMMIAHVVAGPRGGKRKR